MQPGSFQNKRLIVGGKNKIFLGFGSHLISNILVMTRWRVSGNNDRGTGIPQPSWNAWTVMWAHELPRLPMVAWWLVIVLFFVSKVKTPFPTLLGCLDCDWVGLGHHGCLGCWSVGKPLVPTTKNCPSDLSVEIVLSVIHE